MTRELFLDVGVPIICGLCVLALLSLLVWSYLQWAKTQWLLDLTLRWLGLPWWLGIILVLPLLALIIANSIGMAIWIIGRLSGRISKERGAVPIAGTAPEDQPLRRSIIQEPQLLETAAAKRARDLLREANNEWRSEIEMRAKAAGGADATQKGSVTTAIEMQPGDLKIIRKALMVLHLLYPELKDMNLRGYIHGNVVHFQNRTNAIVVTLDLANGDIDKRI